MRALLHAQLGLVNVVLGVLLGIILVVASLSRVVGHVVVKGA